MCARVPRHSHTRRADALASPLFCCISTVSALADLVIELAGCGGISLDVMCAALSPSAATADDSGLYQFGSALARAVLDDRRGKQEKDGINDFAAAMARLLYRHSSNPVARGAMSELLRQRNLAVVTEIVSEVDPIRESDEGDGLSKEVMKWLLQLPEDARTDVCYARCAAAAIAAVGVDAASTVLAEAVANRVTDTVLQPLLGALAKHGDGSLDRFVALTESHVRAAFDSRDHELLVRATRAIQLALALLDGRGGRVEAWIEDIIARPFEALVCAPSVTSAAASAIRDRAAAPTAPTIRSKTHLQVFFLRGIVSLQTQSYCLLLPNFLRSMCITNFAVSVFVSLAQSV